MAECFGGGTVQTSMISGLQSTSLVLRPYSFHNAANMQAIKVSADCEESSSQTTHGSQKNMPWGVGGGPPDIFFACWTT